MIIEISKLSGAALDWAVAKANDGWDLDGPYSEVRVYPAFSLDWAYAGPLIESENISVYRYEVKKIENVVFQAKESKTLSPSDTEIEELMIELIANHTIG